MSDTKVVLDAGAGTGILAAGAARSGASRVIAVEKDRFVCDLLRQAMVTERLNVEVLCGDVAKINLPRVDVVVAELVDVWLLEEQLMSVLRSLFNKGIVDQQTTIIPSAYSFTFEVGRCAWPAASSGVTFPYYEWEFYGSDAWQVPVFESLVCWQDFAIIQTLEAAMQGTGRFAVNFDVGDAEAHKLTEANAVRLSGAVTVGNDVVLRASGSMNAPLVLPIRQYTAEMWRRGIAISAKLSGGLRSLRIRAGAMSILPWRR